MTKHRTITGFVTVALLAVAATAANVRTHAPSTAGTTTSKGIPVDANAPTASFDERWSAMSASKTDTPEQ
jgi:hypothetical protein